MYKFCLKCGNMLREGASFCDGCGTPVAKTPPNDQNDITQKFTDQSFNTQNFNSQNINPQNVNPQNFNAQNINPQNVNPQNFNAQNINPQNVNPQNFNAQNVNAHRTINVGQTPQVGGACPHCGTPLVLQSRAIYIFTMFIGALQLLLGVAVTVSSFSRGGFIFTLFIPLGIMFLVAAIGSLKQMHNAAVASGRPMPSKAFYCKTCKKSFW